MPKPHKRVSQVAQLLQHQLATLINREINDPRLKFVSITDVDLSADLSQAKVYYTVYDDSEKEGTAKALKKATGFIRHQLASRIQMRYVPNIRFVYDSTLESAQRISNLIKDVDPSSEEKEDD